MKRTHHLRIVLYAVFLAVMSSPLAATAQEREFTEFHTWTDIGTIYKFNDVWRYDGDYGLRGVLTDENWTLLYLRPSFRYKDRGWYSLHGGAALFYNFFTDSPDLPELRPYVGVRFIWPRLGRYTFSNYFRFEYRIFYIEPDDKWESVLRGRYQLQLTTPTYKVNDREWVYIIASIEVFEDLTDDVDGSFGDRLRTNIGIGRQVTASWRVELNYLWHQIRVNTGLRDFDLDDHVIRTRLFYSFN